MNSKFELRIEAARLAVNVEGVTPENVISVAKEIETYILGESVLPEQYDANDNLKKMSELISKSFNHSADEKAVEEAKF